MVNWLAALEGDKEIDVINFKGGLIKVIEEYFEENTRRSGNNMIQEEQWGLRCLKDKEALSHLVKSRWFSDDKQDIYCLACQLYIEYR